MPMRTLLKTQLQPENGSRRELAAWVAQAAAQVNDHNYRVLDAGAGEAPYRHYFDHVKYETADFGAVDKSYGELDYVCDLSDLPMPDCTYDLVLCTQVLEHVPDPSAVVLELARVLKPGGELWLSAPLYYPEHEQPYDFYRYTQFAWQFLADKARLEIIELEWLEGYYETLAQQCVFAAQHLPSRNAFSRVGFLALAHWYARSERRRRVTTKGHPKNYRCIMRRREQGEAPTD